MSVTAPDPSKKNRMIWLDCLRLMAGVSMVGLHASSDVSGQPFVDFEPIERVAPVLFRAVVYTARTELFLIISLFLLMKSLDSRPRGYAVTLQEQARRLLIPFAFWVVFYAFYRLIKASYFGYDAAIWSALSSPSAWAGYFLLGNVQYHMHFLPTLFGLVLFFPLYKVGVARPAFGFVILLCLFAKREVDVWMWSELRDLAAFEYILRAVKLVTYAGYGIVAGAFYGLLRQKITDADLRKLGQLALFIGGLLFLIKLVYSYKVIQAGNWQYNYEPAYWADFLMPVVLFAICMGFRGANWPLMISRVAPYSFGIYLMHPVFLDLLEILLWGQVFAPWLFVGIKVVSAIILTSAAVWIVSKFKLFAWTVGLGPLPNLPNLRVLAGLTKQ